MGSSTGSDILPTDAFGFSAKAIKDERGSTQGSGNTELSALFVPLRGLPRTSLDTLIFLFLPTPCMSTLSGVDLRCELIRGYIPRRPQVSTIC